MDENKRHIKDVVRPGKAERYVTTSVSLEKAYVKATVKYVPHLINLTAAQLVQSLMLSNSVEKNRMIALNTAYEHLTTAYNEFKRKVEKEMNKGNAIEALKGILNKKKTLTASDIMQAYGMMEVVPKSVNVAFENCMNHFRNDGYPTYLLMDAVSNASIRLDMHGEVFMQPTTIITIYMDAIFDQIKKYDSDITTAGHDRIMYAAGFLTAIVIKDRWFNMDDIIEAYKFNDLFKIPDSVWDDVNNLVDDIGDLIDDPIDLYKDIINDVTACLFDNAEYVYDENFCKRVMDLYSLCLRKALDSIKPKKTRITLTVKYLVNDEPVIKSSFAFTADSADADDIRDLCISHNYAPDHGVYKGAEMIAITYTGWNGKTYDNSCTIKKIAEIKFSTDVKTDELEFVQDGFCVFTQGGSFPVTDDPVLTVKTFIKANPATNCTTKVSDDTKTTYSIVMEEFHTGLPIIIGTMYKTHESAFLQAAAYRGLTEENDYKAVTVNNRSICPYHSLVLPTIVAHDLIVNTRGTSTISINGSELHKELTKAC